MTTPTRWGTEVLVNTTTASDQQDPAIAGRADGRFVVSWTDGSGGANEAIRAQVFNADGSRSGGEVVVNTTLTGYRYDPDAVALDDGRYAIAWSDDGRVAPDGSLACYTRVFDADTTPAGDAGLANTTTANQQIMPALARLADGGYVVAWTCSAATGGDTSGWAIRAQRFDAAGMKLGGELLVNTVTDASQYRPAATALSGGGFVIAWEDDSGALGDADRGGVVGQVFAADGSKAGGAFLVNTTTAGMQMYPALTGLADGRFVATWTDASHLGSDTDGGAIRGQVFTADGSASGPEFEINTITQGDQSRPSVSALADGRFVVVWRDASGLAGDTDMAVRGRVMNADGTASGEEFLVNATTAGSQAAPDVNSLADGRFVVSWTDNSASPDDPSGAAVRAQVFDARLAAVDLAGSLAGDDFIGTGWGDAMAGGKGADRLAGAGGGDDLRGGGGGDVLLGEAGRDRLSGQRGADILTGGAGEDELSGGRGNDTFVFLDAGDSAAKARKADVVTDFSAGRDLVDLAAIDARSADGDQAFRFIGTRAFHGREGELRLEAARGETHLLGDPDGDGRADFCVVFEGRVGFDAADFLL